MDPAPSDALALGELRFVKRVISAGLAMVLLAAVISVGGKWLGQSLVLAGHSDSLTSREIVIGNNVLAIPDNAIRFEDARRDGVAERLELYLHWPEMEGYSPEKRDAFNNAEKERSIVFLSIGEASMSRDMSGRLAPIYSKLIEPSGRAVAPGLTSHRFIPSSGYQDEELIIGTGQEAYVARCLIAEAATQSLAPCERDLRLGEELSLTYRFPRRLLAQAAELDAKVRSRAQSWLRTAN
ncbi:hypothetical protein [Tianweitania sediminis]|uniref:Transmembrane protein n=1 Tax=Tianweitania sediminis TaxID=1502156 RepID=A0A8J7RM15_9HYPH|nr:hypothetical protein [Tianweitania sediminis]MBP0439656.1 hypothetical protein [Tianweitania sediminis]